MKSTTYIAEITAKKYEKYLVSASWEKFTCLLACLLASIFHVSFHVNFPHEFTEKCFAVFDQSSCTIYLTWYQLLLFFQEFSSIIPFMVGLEDSSQVNGRGYNFISSIVC